MNEKRKAISRREFLKAAGLGIAAAGVSTVVAQPMLTQTALAAGVRPRAKKQAKEIRVLVVGDPFQFALEKVLDDFTAQTGIKVNLESLAYDALNARLVTSFVSQTPDADVVTVDAMWTGQYFDNRWVISLNDYIKADSDVNLKDFIPEVLYSLNLWRGNFVSLPIAAYGQGVMYRTDVFEKAGLEPPPTNPDKAAGWTWDKYLEIVKQLQGMEMDGTKLYGTVIVGAQPVPIVHMYTQLAASRGVRWFKHFPEAPWDFEPTINSPENVESLKFYKALYELSPAESINYVWFDAGTRFSQGDIGIFFWWTPYFYLVKNDGYMSGTPSKIIDKFAVALLPKLSDDAPQVISNGGWSLGIPSSSAKQDEAWQFIKWACSAETQKKMGLVKDYNYQFSDFARVSLYQDTELKAIYPYLDTQLKLMQMGNGKISRPPMPIYSTLEAIYGLQINKVLSGAATPEDSLKETDALFRNALTGNFMLPYKLESYDDTLENARKLIDSLAS
ncbi:MAG: ABC transporter substrate-binding protein [Anaerolineae bacterium]